MSVHRSASDKLAVVHSSCLFEAESYSGQRERKSVWEGSLRTADVFPVVASLSSLPPKNNVFEPEWQNDFRDVKPFVLMLANQIKG